MRIDQSPGPGGPSTSELVVRDNICICGRMNAGKSTLMNLITGQATSIVDQRPGTTADVKAAVMQIHDFGPVKLFDTAGMDEGDVLGRKKQEKSLIALKESDIVILVVEPVEVLRADDASVETRMLKLAEEYEKQAFIIFNIHSDNGGGAQAVESLLPRLATRQPHPHMAADLADPSSRRPVLEFLKTHYDRDRRTVDLMPFLGARGFVALNIPMDEETPAGRLLRPQHVVLDYILRHYLPFAGYRMNLVDARSPRADIRETERTRYLRFIDDLRNGDEGLQLIITDTQAVDCLVPWTPDGIPVTTFSIVMAHHQSGGNLKTLVQGLSAMESLASGDRVLIAELCNHDRKAEDIGTKQIPRLLRERVPDIGVDFSEGREFPSEDELRTYRLVIQCGGCMVDRQKYSARMEDSRKHGIPVTNYGLALSWLYHPESLRRVLEPWGV